jgi:hypothetical protein
MADPLDSAGSHASAGFVTLPSLWGVARHSAPRVVEATLIPTGLLYAAVKITGSVWPGAIAALVWAVLLLAGRALRSRRIPGILVLAVIGLAIRTAVAMASGSTFLYFLQPVITTMVVAAVFLASLRTDRPMVARLAQDFCPLTSDITDRVGVKAHFRRLTVMWSAVNVVNGMLTLWLLLALQSSSFLAMKTVTVAGVTWTAVVVTVVASLRVCRTEGLRYNRGARLA